MGIAWLGLLVEIIIFSFFSNIIDYTEVASVLIIGINMFLVLIYLLTYNGFYRKIFISGFFLRIFCVFWDIYASDIFLLPNSGGDSIDFWYSATEISRNIELLFYPTYGGIYSKLIGTIFYFTGEARLLAQYINVLCGMTVVILLYKTLKLLEVNQRTTKLSLFIIIFFPNAIIFSSIFLREAVVSTGVMLSAYYLVKWYKHNKFSYMLISMASLLFASIFHAAVLTLSVGYIFLFMFYQEKNKKFVFTYRSIVIFGMFLVLFAGIFFQFNEIFLKKFMDFDEFGDIYIKASSSMGDSIYLENVEINSLANLIIYGPLKMLFFLFSPLPMNWRGATDVLAFLFDGLFYLLMVMFIFRNFKFVKGSSITICILIGLIVTCFIFGLGTSNAGTAMRHRHKLLPLFLLLFSIVDNFKYSNYMDRFKKQGKYGKKNIFK